MNRNKNIKCNVCGEHGMDLLYSSPTNVSLSSLCELMSRETNVYLCRNCTHVYTPPIPNINEYYANEYEILTESEEEDQIVSFPDGRKEYRFELQVNVFLKKMSIPNEAKILDYGCAKSTTLKKIVEKNQSIIPHVYDVSNMYLPFWEKFIAKDNVAVFELKDSWTNYFDVVTSFFSLEHVEDPAGMMQKVSQVLKNDGYFYCIVPNMYVNPADFIVADHVNHFSVYSIFSLMDITGFNVIDIDTTSHYGAIILVAQKTRPEKKKPESLETDKQEIARSATEISSFWTDILNKINKFENEAGESDKAAIYGSGFYGALILSTLKNPDVVKYFVDQNIYKQGNMLFDKKIVAPSELPEDIQIVYVGLNPSVAKNSIHAIEDWKDRAYHYCYL